MTKPVVTATDPQSGRQSIFIETVNTEADKETDEVKGNSFCESLSNVLKAIRQLFRQNP